MKQFVYPFKPSRPGSQAKISALDLSGNIRRRILDLGLVTNTLVETIGKSPSGDPTAYYIRGASYRDQRRRRI